MTQCAIPPEGWWCSREAGHEGPCAARPTQQHDEPSPVAWLYESEAGDKELILDCNGEYARRLLEHGYTETPLFTRPTQSQAEGLVEELEALRQRAATAEHRLLSFRQHHAARGEQLRQFIKDRAPELWPDYAAISVNGSVYSDDYTLEPVFERELNILRHRAEEAEARATKAEAALSPLSLPDR